MHTRTHRHTRMHACACCRRVVSRHVYRHLCRHVYIHTHRAANHTGGLSVHKFLKIMTWQEQDTVDHEELAVVGYDLWPMCYGL